MSWFRIDDGFYDHPKVLAAGNAAAGLFTRLGAYASKHATDGHIPDTIVRQFGTRSEIATLIRVGMLEHHVDHYIIHDYLHRNPSAEQLKADRAATAERQRRWRESHVANGHRDAVSNTVTNGAPTHPIPIEELLTDVQQPPDVQPVPRGLGGNR